VTFSEIGGVNALPPDEQRAALKAVARAALAEEVALDMSMWHKTDTCGTTHCIGGWAQALSTDPAMKALHPSVAGALILGPVAANHFGDDDKTAREWLKSVLANSQLRRPEDRA
jgi:hypothetical protein